MVALMLPMLLGIAALGTDVGFAMFKQRQMQTAADAAALGAATALMTGHPAYLIEARALTAAVGFTNGADGVTVTVNNGPASGLHVGDTDYVEVIVRQPQTLPLSSLFYAGPWDIGARAVAKQGSTASYCLLALDSGSTTGIKVTNGANVALNQCGLATNATGSAALLVSGGAKLQTTTVSVGGTVSVNNGARIVDADGHSIVGTSSIKEQQAALSDPYSNVDVPTSTSCTYGTPGHPYHVIGQTNPTLNPGVYCGITMDNGGKVTMNPGVYIIKGGTFSVQGINSLVGTGVTIVLTNWGSTYANMDIGNGPTVTLSAPTTGETAGLLFFQDPKAPKPSSNDLNNSWTIPNRFQGGAKLNLTGALYFPSQSVSYSNGTSTTSTCTQLIAWHISFEGGASFNSNCANTGVGSIGGAAVSQLVE